VSTCSIRPAGGGVACHVGILSTAAPVRGTHEAPRRQQQRVTGEPVAEEPPQSPSGAMSLRRVLPVVRSPDTAPGQRRRARRSPPRLAPHGCPGGAAPACCAPRLLLPARVAIAPTVPWTDSGLASPAAGASSLALPPHACPPILPPRPPGRRTWGAACGPWRPSVVVPAAVNLPAPSARPALCRAPLPPWAPQRWATAPCPEASQRAGGPAAAL
jgi:hypothetical protein